MTDWREIERRLTEAVGPRRRPVAVAFRAAPPAGVPPSRLGSKARARV
jgi:hypothetical protein